MEAEPLSDIVKAVAPSIAVSSMQVGLASGIAGAAFGGVVGMLRTTTPTLFAIASGIQCFGIGTMYWGLRKSMLVGFARNSGTSIFDVASSQRRQASTISGALTGMITGALVRGRSHILPGALMFSLVAFSGQSLYDSLDQGRPNETDSPPGDTLLHKFAKSRFSPVQTLSTDEYRTMLQEKDIRIEAEIAILDDRIGALQRQAEQQEKTSGN